MFNPAIRLSGTLLLLAATTSWVSAQYTPSQYATPMVRAGNVTAHQGGLPVRNNLSRLQPVPRAGTQIRSTAKQPHNPQHSGWNLKWRRSSQVPLGQPTTKPTRQVNSQPNVGKTNIGKPSVGKTSISKTSAVVQASHPQSTGAGELRSAGVPSKLSAGGRVSRVAWVNQPPQGDEGFQLPPTLPQQPEPQQPEPQRSEQDAAGPADAPNFFDRPFGDDAPPTAQPEIVLPESATPETTPSPANDLRSEAMRNGLRNPSAGPAIGTPPPSDNGASIGEMIRQQQPDPPVQQQTPAQQETPLLPPNDAGLPNAQEGAQRNPFEQNRDAEADRRDRDRFNRGEPGGAGPAFDRLEDRFTKQSLLLNCEDHRDRIRKEKITQISLDISPPFRPDIIDPLEYEQLKARFDDKQVIRTWRAIDGSELATGRLRDLAYEHVIIETETGDLTKIPIASVSEGDLGYISENWGLPRECRLEQVAYAPRNWTPLTMTWKASNLCHNPLYFEEVNLERYGHTAGPVLQPAVSTAHFFANIAVLPYKMGVHAPNECQYALGYYRPGNCAPWIVPPVPISLRGGLSQAATVTGLFWLVP
ncbi:MAG: hypothetical protein MI861_25485 [Pirellulales bacterium]|nr:hypothetical protein [Pirellulales bacterium]